MKGMFGNVMPNTTMCEYEFWHPVWMSNGYGSQVANGGGEFGKRKGFVAKRRLKIIKKIKR